MIISTVLRKIINTGDMFGKKYGYYYGISTSENRVR